MDCGDGGHILVSRAVAEELQQVSTWGNALHDLGEAEVKHGVKVHLYNFYTETAGKRELPQKLLAAHQAASRMASQRRRKRIEIAVVALLVLAATASLLYWKRSHQLSEKDRILLSDFTNTTGDTVFDDTLKQGLAAALEQSPFLDILSERRVYDTLRLMGRSPEERMTTPSMREVCLRTGSKAREQSTRNCPDVRFEEGGG
jgi:hypothetical protein